MDQCHLLRLKQPHNSPLLHCLEVLFHQGAFFTLVIMYQQPHNSHLLHCLEVLFHQGAFFTLVIMYQEQPHNMLLVPWI
jgi:hypothetical protein